MQTSSRATRQPVTVAEHPHSVAFSIQLSQNQVVQALGMGMVSLMGLTILPWPAVLAWTLVAIVAVAAEHHCLRLAAGGGRASRAAGAWAPALRVLATTVYAAAAFALLVRGGPGERLFAFALMSASMVHVLMRYYRSPLILVASLSPYVIVLGVAGFGLARMALQQRHLLGALAPVFAITMFAIQFWSARAQLAGAWIELMTAREAAEQRERAADAANRAKSQFLATMSHELRTPLNGVLGMAQALTTDRLTRVQHERVNIIRRSSESLLSVLNDLLDLSKIEAGALEPEVVEFDLEHLVRGVAAAYQPLAAKKALAFEFEVAEEVRGRYLGDSARIRQILYSLSDNAVKFTQEGGVTLRVERDVEHVIFRVTDTGIGIADDDLAHLFEGFFQADSTLTRRYGGTGIGLAICGELATLMDGVIEASSKLGEGSAFTLMLPLKPAEALAESRASETQSFEPEPTVELRVLAAEDNTTNQLVLKTLLASAGIGPTIVVNGRAALAAWEGQTWDIVLMDIQMPEMNGIEATQAIRQRELETGRPRTPIIAVTANAMTHQVVEYEAAGMDGVVAKPVNMANLFNVMEQALAQAAAPAEPSRRNSAA
jgi:signal transduction histidine kinase/ActR/RegA family two-component response regulator